MPTGKASVDRGRPADARMKVAVPVVNGWLCCRAYMLQAAAVVATGGLHARGTSMHRAMRARQFSPAHHSDPRLLPRVTALVTTCSSSAELTCAGASVDGWRARGMEIRTVPLLRLRGAGRQDGGSRKGGKGGASTKDKQRGPKGKVLGAGGDVAESGPQSFQRLLDEQRGRGDGLADRGAGFDGARGFRGKRARDTAAANAPQEGGHSNEVS